MNVTATSSNTQPSPTTGLTGETGDMFLKLLTTQLKAQDPLSPMDPTQFVNQLVDFNTLGEIMRIRQLLDPSTQPAADATEAATSPKAGGN
ncbi:MAG TPA: flagellar hook capping FlgD N-terminal domain-containing protein [Terriglobales bacterium]